MNVFDSHTIEIPCPHCSHKASQTVGKLKLNPNLVCSGCRKPFRANPNEINAELRKAEQALTKLQRSLSRLGK